MQFFIAKVVMNLPRSQAHFIVVLEGYVYRFIQMMMVGEEEQLDHQFELK